MNHTMTNLLLASTRIEFSCSEHYGNELLFWCNTCESLICKICVGSAHRQHEIDKCIGEKIVKQYKKYKTKRFYFLYGEFTGYFKKKVEEISPVCDNYFTKILNESQSVIQSSLTTFESNINKYNSNIQSQQQTLIDKIRALKDKIKKTAFSNGQFMITNEEIAKIKQEMQNIKQHAYYPIKELKTNLTENYITPNTICVPLEFKVKYPLNMNSNFKVILKQNNGHTMVFKVSFENVNKNNVILFEIKISDLIKPLPVVWGVSVFSKSGRDRNYLHKRFTFNANSNSVYDNSKKLSVVIAESLNACEDILLTENVNNPTAAIIKIDVHLRYLNYTSIKEF